MLVGAGRRGREGFCVVLRLGLHEQVCVCPRTCMRDSRSPTPGQTLSGRGQWIKDFFFHFGSDRWLECLQWATNEARM